MSDIAAPVEQKDSEPVVQSEDKVAYATFKKVLDEKKATQNKLTELQAQLDKFNSEREEQENARLAEQNRWKELYEKEVTKARRAEELAEGVKRQVREQKKKEALMAEIGLKREEFVKFVDFDTIPDADDGFDVDALKAYAMEFKKNFPELVREVKAPPPTGAAPSVVGSPSNYDLKNPKEVLEAYKRSIGAK
jgi:hypothetical protein